MGNPQIIGRDFQKFAEGLTTLPQASAAVYMYYIYILMPYARLYAAMMPIRIKDIILDIVA